MVLKTTLSVGNGPLQGSATLSLPRAPLAIHNFVEGSRKK
jgi:hypothetical protein